MKKTTVYAAIAVMAAVATTLTLRAQSDTPKESAQAVSFGNKVAPFTLPDPAGKPVSVGDWDKSKATVILFIATKCPVSNDYNSRMSSLAKTYTPKGVKFIGINSNKAELGPEVASHAKAHDLDFTILKDPGNKIADRFSAKVTPEAYVVGPSGDLLYWGRIDNSRNEGEVKDKSLQVALDSVLEGKPVAEKETRAFGCSIKREG